MALSDVLTNVAKKAGYKVGSTFVGSTATLEAQLLAIANTVIQEMADAYPWPKLWKTGSVTLSNGTASYALPGDFSHYHHDTFWNQNDDWPVYGPMSPEEYASYQGEGIDPLYDRFTIRGVTDTQLLFTPTPGAGDASQVVAFEYIAARPVRPPTWASGQCITSGDYRFANGIYYTASSSGTTSGAAITSDGGVTWTTYSGTYLNFLDDDDEPVLSSRILEQGVFERFAETKGVTFVPRYREQLDEEYAKALTGKTLYAGGDDVLRRVQFGRNGVVRFGG